MKEFKSLDITDEERESILRYAGPFHTNINSILDFDPSVISKLSKDWNIDFSSDTIKKYIDDIINVYSAMYKNSYGKDTPLYTIRGTSASEAIKLHSGDVYNRFVSTTLDKDIASQFTEYQNGAIMNIRSQGIPYINVQREDGINEKEILLSPFCKIKSITDHSNSRNEYSEYDVDLGKDDFESLPQEQEDEIYQYLNDNGNNISSYIKEYEESAEKYESVSQKYQNSQSLEERRHLEEVIEKITSRRRELREKLNEFKEKTQSYIKSKLKGVELEIDKNVSKEIKERKDDAHDKDIENTRNYKNNLIDLIDSRIGKDIPQISKDVQERSNYQEKLQSLAQEFGITLKMNSYFPNEKLVQIEEFFMTLRKEVQQIEIPDNVTPEQLEEIKQSIHIRYGNVMHVSQKLTSVKGEIKALANDDFTIVKGKIIDSIEQKIKEEKKVIISDKLQKLTSKKSSIFDRITGKDKVKQAEMENCELQLQLLSSTPNNVIQMSEAIADVDIFLKECTDEDTMKRLLDLKSKVLSKFNVSQTKIDRHIESKQNTNTALIDTASLKSGNKNKRQAEYLQTQNSELRHKIKNVSASNKNIADTLSGLINNRDGKPREDIDSLLNSALGKKEIEVVYQKKDDKGIGE